MVFLASVPSSVSFRWTDWRCGPVWTAHQHSSRARIPKQELMFKIRCNMHVLAKPRLTLNVSAALRMCHTNKLQLRILINNSYFGLLLIPKMPPVMLFLSKEHTNSHARALIGRDQSVQGQGEHSWRSWYNWSLEGLTGRIPLFSICVMLTLFTLFLLLVSSG